MARKKMFKTTASIERSNPTHIKAMRLAASNMGVEHLVRDEADALDIFRELVLAYCDGLEMPEDQVEAMVLAEVNFVADLA